MREVGVAAFENRELKGKETLHERWETMERADAIVVGAGAGLSASAGFSYSGKRFTQWCAPWEEKYDVHDFYSAGFYPFPACEEFWAYWSASILANRYECGVGDVYVRLKQLLEGKEYFVITTNVDHQFQLAGFDKRHLFYTQGDYGLFQCSKPCCQETFDNEEMVRAMHGATVGTSIPKSLIPRCPYCGSELTTNLRADDRFVQDEDWHRAAERYSAFLRRYEGLNVLFLELGVGFNTPVIIKYPLWQMTSQNRNAVFATINYGEPYVHPAIADRSIAVNADIAQCVTQLLTMKEGLEQ